MVRAQIVALSVGATIAVIGGVLAWQGLLPGVPPMKPRIVNEAPLPAKSDPAKPVPAPKSSTQVEPKAAVANGAPAPVAPDLGQKEGGKKPEVARAAPEAAVAAQKPESAPAPKPVTSAPPPQPAPIIPKFDTVRVEPSGEFVVAGHGGPGAKVDLMAGDKVVAQAQADAGGDFVMVPQALAPGNYVLALRSYSGKGTAVQSVQTVTVSVPAKGQKGLVVALTEPGKASVLLADPTAKAAAAPAEKKAEPLAKEKQPTAPVAPEVAFKTVESEKGGFYATGIAPPGTHLRIYLNGSRVADVVADAEGRWSMTIGKGMTPGHYAVRADAIDAAGKVMARAEVPFDIPAGAVMAKLERKFEPAGETGSESKNGAQSKTTAPAPAKDEGLQSSAPKMADTGLKPADAAAKKEVAANAPPQTATSSAVVPEISTASVHRGDSLWRISRKIFGRGIRYTLIYAANAGQIRDPNLIYPGQVFVLPKADH